MNSQYNLINACLLIVAGFLALLLGSCQTGLHKLSPPETVAVVDLNRYAGEWHEVARLPVFYQADEERAIARYTPRRDGRLDVLNTAVAPDGARRSVTGIATPVPGSGNAKLRVKIDKWPATWIPVPAQGNYWILDLAPDYSYALVGTPDRKFLWLLSRRPDLDKSQLTAMIERADALGYPVHKLIFPGRKAP